MRCSAASVVRLHRASIGRAPDLRASRRGGRVGLWRRSSRRPRAGGRRQHRSDGRGHRARCLAPGRARPRSRLRADPHRRTGRGHTRGPAGGTRRDGHGDTHGASREHVRARVSRDGARTRADGDSRRHAPLGWDAHAPASPECGPAHGAGGPRRRSRDPRDTALLGSAHATEAAADGRVADPADDRVGRRDTDGCPGAQTGGPARATAMHAVRSPCLLTDLDRGRQASFARPSGRRPPSRRALTERSS